MKPESPLSLNYWLKDILVLGFILGVVGWQFKPVFSGRSLGMADDYDGSFIAWSMATIQNKILGIDQEGGWFDGGIFFPEKNTLAYSDYYLLPALMTLPLRWITDEPVIVFNSAMILAQALTGVMLFFWLHEICHDRRLALAGVMVYILAPGRMIYAGSLSTFWLWGVPLSLLALQQLSLKASKAWLGVWFGGFWIQLTTNFLSAWFILFASGVLLIFNGKLRQNLRILSRTIVIAIAISGLVGLSLIYPYLWVAHTHHYRRPITDVIHFSMSPEEIFGVYFSPVIMALVGLGLVIKRKLYPYHWLSLASIIMAMGPVMHWMKKTIKIPLPYMVFYYLAPGFNGFRAPSRWMALALIAAVAAGVVGLTRLKSFWRGVTASGMIILALVLARPVDPVKAPTVAEAPEVYTWLKFQPPGAVIELPMFRWGSTSANKNEVYRMIYQTVHRMPMVNGYSGFSSPEWENLVARLQTDFPSDALINELKARGVKYLIIHQDEYQKWFQKRMVIETMKPIYQDDSTMVYGF